MKYIKTAECYVVAYCKYKQGNSRKDDAEIIFYKFPNFFENGCFMADCDVVLNIRDDLQETMRECRDVTEKYRTGRSAYLRLGQLLMRLFAGLL